MKSVALFVLLGSLASVAACSKASGGASVSVETQTPSGSSSHGFSIGNGGVPATSPSACAPGTECDAGCAGAMCK